MTFFTYFYLEDKMYFQDYVKYFIIFIALGALFIATTLYLRHRLETKYRDLSIISLLLIILLLGIQYQQYEQNQVYANDTSRIVTFLNSIKDAKQVNREDLKVNSIKLMNGMILAIQQNYYEVHFNQDFTAYSLAEIHLVNPDIQIIDKENK